MDNKYLKNWGCGAYRFSHNEKKDYGYQELKKYFFVRDEHPIKSWTDKEYMKEVG